MMMNNVESLKLFRKSWACRKPLIIGDVITWKTSGCCFGGIVSKLYSNNSYCVSYWNHSACDLVNKEVFIDRSGTSLKFHNNAFKHLNDHYPLSHWERPYTLNMALHVMFYYYLGRAIISCAPREYFNNLGFSPVTIDSSIKIFRDLEEVVMIDCDVWSIRADEV
jgi:hypothetical protein